VHEFAVFVVDITEGQEQDQIVSAREWRFCPIEIYGDQMRPWVDAAVPDEG
jgi:hypothetical protein